MATVRWIFTLTFVVATFTWLRLYPIDEALVRTAIWAAILGLAYLAIRAAVAAFRR